MKTKVRRVFLVGILAGLLLILGVRAFAQKKPEIRIWGRTVFVDAVNTWIYHKIEKWSIENNVDVKISLLPANKFNEKIMAAVAAGNEPDVVVMGWPVALYAEKGLLLPLDDIIEKLDPEDIFPLKLNENKVGEHVYAIPMMVEANPFHMRKDILEKNGLAVPTTLDEIAEAAKKISRPEEDFYGLGLSLGKGMDSQYGFLTIQLGFGGGWLSDLTPEGAEVFKSEATYKALEWIKDLYDAKAMPPDVTEWTDWHDNKNFASGRIGMAINAPSIYYLLIQTDPGLAANTICQVPKEGIVDCGEESAFVFKSTKYPDLSKDLVYFLFKDKEDYRKGFVEAAWTYGLPIFKSQARVISEQWKEGKWRFWTTDPYRVCEISKLMNPVAYPYGKATSVSDKIVTGYVISDMLGKVFVEKKPIKQAVEETYQIIVDLVKEAYGPFPKK